MKYYIYFVVLAEHNYFKKFEKENVDLIGESKPSQADIIIKSPKPKDAQQNKYPCDKCNRSYVHLSSLFRHKRYGCDMKRQAKIERKRIYKCHKCNRKYVNEKSLNSHKNLDCGFDQKFKCAHCCFKSKRKGNLRIHIIRMHLKTSIHDHYKNSPRN